MCVIFWFVLVNHNNPDMHYLYNVFMEFSLCWKKKKLVTLCLGMDNSSKNILQNVSFCVSQKKKEHYIGLEQVRIWLFKLFLYTQLWHSGIATCQCFKIPADAVGHPGIVITIFIHECLVFVHLTLLTCCFLHTVWKGSMHVDCFD